MLSMLTNPDPTNNNLISGPGMPCTLTHPRIDVDKNCCSNKKLHRQVLITLVSSSVDLVLCNLALIEENKTA